MKNLMCFIIAAMVASLPVSPVFAEELKGGIIEEGMGNKKMMHGMMRGASIVASTDGGVIVLNGNKLYKYDKNLNLVKEADLKVEPGKANKMCCHGAKKMNKEDQAEKAADPSQKEAEHTHNE